MLLVWLIAPTKALAWGEKGHKLVAEVAFKKLDRKTRKLVLQYLDGMTIEKAATWMDDIKKDKSYDKLKPLHYVNFDKGSVVKDTCCDKGKLGYEVGDIVGLIVGIEEGVIVGLYTNVTVTEPVPDW